MTIQESDSIVFYSEQEQVWENEKGERHREDGPSFIFPDGTQYWYVNGKPVT